VTSPDGTASISVPRGWNTDERGLYPTAVIAVGDNASHEFLFVTEARRVRLGSNSSTDDFLAQVKTAFGRSLPDGVWGSSSKVKINGLNGLATELVGPSNHITYFVYALANRSSYYAVIGFTNTALVSANKGTLQGIAYSFKASATRAAGGWRPYSLPGSLILAIFLLVLGAGLILLGARLKSAVKVPRPGTALKIAIVAVWAILVSFFLFLYAVSDKTSPRAVQNGPIFPITISCAVLSFAYLLYATRHDGFLNAVGNGIVGAAVGPMIFEFPFDWIVIPQIQTSAVYLVAFFTPLFAIELSTLSLLPLCRRASITRYSLFSLGAMFIVFALWALEGFSSPSSPVSFILNAVSKVLSFTTAVALFSPAPNPVVVQEKN
jgi:hypothetical protein